MKKGLFSILLASTVMVMTPSMAIADSDAGKVKAGVDAWQQGDYSRAVTQWRPEAERGDADAQFNMGQAYKLGRGVSKDLDQAAEWYRKAAVQGHHRAEDNYGLLLFQQEKRTQAMPYIRRSAERGDERAQYIYGTALFNGEGVQKDWVLAYAMMTRSAASGLSQARNSLTQMDKFIPEAQRRQGTALAARSGSTTQSPAAPSPSAKPQPASTATAAPRGSAAPAPAANGRWRVQLGAFSEEARAKTLWNSISKRVSGLSAYKPAYVKAGGVTRLQAGPLASEADANRLCRSIKAAGQDCMPRRM